MLVVLSVCVAVSVSVSVYVPVCSDCTCSHFAAIKPSHFAAIKPSHTESLILMLPVKSPSSSLTVLVQDLCYSDPLSSVLTFSDPTTGRDDLSP